MKPAPIWTRGTLGMPFVEWVLFFFSDFDFNVSFESLRETFSLVWFRFNVLLFVSICCESFFFDASFVSSWASVGARFIVFDWVSSSSLSSTSASRITSTMCFISFKAKSSNALNGNFDIKRWIEENKIFFFWLNEENFLRFTWISSSANPNDFNRWMCSLFAESFILVGAGTCPLNWKINRILQFKDQIQKFELC